MDFFSVLFTKLFGGGGGSNSNVPKLTVEAISTFTINTSAEVKENA